MPARQLLWPTYLTGALDSGSNSLRTASPIGRPAPSPTSDSDPASLRPGYVRTLLVALLRLAQPKPIGAIRPGTPARKGPGANGAGSAQSQNHDTGTITCTLAGTVLLNRPNTNSIVGADIYVYSIVGAIGLPYGKKPPTYLWTSIVGARVHHT